MARNFWMLVCNQENFHITKSLSFTIQGLKAQHRRKVQRVESGDRMLFYVSGCRQFTATVTVTSAYQEEETDVWQNEGKSGWPYQVGIKPEIVLDEPQYMEAGLLAHRLDYVRRWPPENWYIAFQGNLHLLPKNDFFLIEEEMKKLKFGADYDYNAVPPPVAERQRASGRNYSRGARSPKIESVDRGPAAKASY